MTDQLLPKVREDIRKTGYPLELRVCRRLQALDYHVATNVYFVDRDERKPREIDIRALKNAFLRGDPDGGCVRHCLLIECKKSSSRPWVLFTSPPVSDDQNVRDIACRGVSSRWIASRQESLELRQQHPLFALPFRGRSFYEAFSNSQESHQSILKAVLASLKATVDARDEYFAAAYSHPNAIFYYPVVVLEGDLFVASIGKSRLSVKRATVVPVSVHYHSPEYKETRRHTVTIVREAALPALLEGFDRWLGLLAEKFKRRPSCFAPPNQPTGKPSHPSHRAKPAP